jgi:tRNA(Ile)-lysidine synthase
MSMFTKKSSIKPSSGQESFRLISIIIAIRMLDNLSSILRHACCLDLEKPVLVAVSGGPDSLCLLHALWSLGYPVIVAHFDHSLRQESKAEAAAVQDYARQMSLTCVVGKEDVQAFATAQGLSLEEAARTRRYPFLFQEAHLYNAQAVAIGHTADDQVETVLMHLLRGAGLSGLCGMDYRSLPNAWSQDIPLVRPLLGVWRSEIVEYLEKQDLQASLDASNLDPRFYRNRLRLEVFPYLEKLNPGLRQRLWRMADIVRQEDQILESLAEAAWQACLLESGAGYLALDAKKLRDQALGLQRRLARKAIAYLRPGLRNIDYDAIQRTLDSLRAEAQAGPTDLVAGLRLEYEGERLWLATWESDLPGGDWPAIEIGGERTLPAPGEVVLQGGWRLSAEKLPASPEIYEQACINADPYQAWLDLDSLSLPLCVRARRPGERMRPLGMGGHSLKIADLMVNVRLPRRARAHWPLVVNGSAAGGEVAWLPGYRLGHTFRLKPETRQILHLRLEKADNI